MWKLAGRYASVGIEMTAGVTIGTLGGLWLDSKFGTHPYLLIFGVVVGMGAAAKVVYRIARTTRL